MAQKSHAKDPDKKPYAEMQQMPEENEHLRHLSEAEYEYRLKPCASILSAKTHFPNSFLKLLQGAMNGTLMRLN